MQENGQNTTNNSEMELIAKVQLSGSLIAKNRETLAFQAEVRDDSTGFIFAPSKKEVYDIDELKKARDLELVELIPPNPETELDLVPRPLYEEALEALAIAEETINIQTQTIGQLEATVADLENQVETLKEEVDNEKLLRVLAEDNYETARQEIGVITQDSQLSYQRSILEGIEKTSLEAKNEGLNAQVEALKDELAAKQSEIDQLQKSINGKEAQIDAGAKTNTEITVRVLEIAKPTEADLKLDSIKVNSGDDPYGDGKWENGPTLEIYNFTAEIQTIKFDTSGTFWISSMPSFQLNPNQIKKVTVPTDGGEILSARPWKGSQDAKSYFGSILVKSNSSSVTLDTTMYKHKKR